MTIEQLFARGRAAYLATFETSKADRMIGTTPSLAVVTREDFLTFPDLCLEALEMRPSLYILTADGDIRAMLCRHRFT